MTITDDSTGLDTAYTEKEVVAFTAGTLASINDCVTEVESKLKRGTLSASSTPSSTEVQRWLIRAKQELAETKGYTFKRRYASVSTVAAQYRYSLPPDFNGGRVMLKDISNDRVIPIWEEYWFDLKYPDPSQEGDNEPLVAGIKGLELWLVPPPDAVYSLELEYDRSGDDNTPTDFSWLPEIERFRCCDGAAAEAFSSLHMWQEASYYTNRWERGIGKARRADGKRRWKRMRYQAISFQQEYQASNYQKIEDGN